MVDFQAESTKLRVINGYIGSVILNASGESIFVDKADVDMELDISFTASVYNNAFMSINESSLDIGFNGTRTLESVTKDGYTFLLRSVSTENFDVTIFLILKDNANLGLAKILLEKLSLTIEENFED